MEKKSANKLWRESKSTLSFKEWIERENKKKTENQEGNFLPFSSGVPSNVIKDTLTQAREDVERVGGYRTEASNQTVFGLDKRIVIFSGILIVGALAVVAYKKLKDKK